VYRGRPILTLHGVVSRFCVQALRGTAEEALCCAVRDHHYPSFSAFSGITRRKV